MKTFAQVWADTGYDYGEDALESVRLGWELAMKTVMQELHSRFSEELGDTDEGMSMMKDLLGK